MLRISSAAIGLALPITLVSHAALADLTPAQVWGDWRDYMQGMGYEISGTETAQGSDLVISDVVMRFDAADGTSGFAIDMERVDLLQNRDGSVEIVLPGSIPMVASGIDNEVDGGDVTMTLVVTQTGHTMTASGTPEELVYDFSAATIGVTLQEMSVDGTPVDPSQAQASFLGTNITTSTTMTIGDVRGYEQSGTLDALTYDMAFTDLADPNSSGKIKGQATDLVIEGSGAIPLDIAPGADAATMMRAGFAVTGAISYGSGSSDFDIKDLEDGNVRLISSSQGGTFGVSMSSEGLAYDVGQRGLNVAVTSNQMPFPFEMSMAESAFGLALPVAKSDTPQDFALKIGLTEFAMSDVIWGMFDPAGQLPRDPANILLDLGGKVKLLVDWMDPEQAGAMAFGAPGELQAVNLNTLLLDAAGARLEGDGAVTFDGSGPAMVPGLGSPVGAINLALAGGNGLLDKLVSMGLLPQDQAMGARMMMGLFAVPGDGPDTLKSKIEFTQDGQILANGQRIR